MRSATLTPLGISRRLVEVADHGACGMFWVWLYAERERRDGREPEDNEKRAVIDRLWSMPGVKRGGRT